MSTDDAQPHRCQAPKARAVELAHLDGLVGGAWLVCGQQPAEGARNIVGIGRRSFDVALERNSAEVKRGAAGVLLIDPAMGRPGEKVRDEEGHTGVGPDRVESRIVLHAVELDDVVRFNKRQDANLSLIHISEPTRLGMISYAVFCLKKKKK